MAAAGPILVRALLFLTLYWRARGEEPVVKVADFLPGVMSESSCTKPSTVATWLTARQRAERSMPPIAQLASTVLSMEGVFNRTLRRCAGDHKKPRLVDEGSAPGFFCVFPTSEVELFDQYAVERSLVARWLEHVEVCGGSDTRSFRASCRGADVVIVPSLNLHFFATHGTRWSWMSCLGRRLYDVYWTRLRELFFDNTTLPPVVVVHHSWYFCNPSGLSFLDRLAMQPPAFKARVLVTVPMSSQTTAFKTKFSSAWSDNGLDELLRREAIAQARLSPGDEAGRKGTEEAVVSDPTLVSVPVTVGITDTPVPWADWDRTQREAERSIAVLMAGAVHERRGFGPMLNQQVVRPKLAGAMRSVGGTCGQAVCAVCTAASSGGGTCALPEGGVYALATRSIFCVEPPGDTYGRSHTYVAIASGCIPGAGVRATGPCALATLTARWTSLRLPA